MKSAAFIFACILMSLFNCFEIQATDLEVRSQVTSDQGENARRFPPRVLPNGQAKTLAQHLYQGRSSIVPYPGRAKPEECYSCVDCPFVQGNTTVTTCPYENPTCVVYAELYSYQKKPLYIRGCVLERGACDEIEKVHRQHVGIKLLYCAECIGDRCNSNDAARSLPDLIAALFFVIIAPVVTKCALS